MARAFDHRDWRFVALTGFIADAESLEHIAERVGFHSLPEMVYSQNLLELSCGSFSLRFTAADALRLCALASSSADSNEALAPVQVACAQEWAASIDPSARVIERKHDWTFSSTFGGAAFIKNGAADQTEREPDSLTHALSFQPDEQAAIQYALLQPPLPILWASNEILLYEDELHDCGSSRLSVKARVMPDCWFVLLRLYLRVDRVLVRIRDVRVFHAFGADCVVQEVQLREESWDSLRQRGLPDEPSFYVNVDRVAELVPVSRKHTMSVKLNSA